MIIFISIFSIVCATLGILYLFGVYDLILIYANYKKIVNNDLTNYTYKDFSRVINNINSALSLQIGNYSVVLLKETLKGVDLVIKINTDYYSITNQGLIYLFNSEEELNKKVKSANKAVKNV